MSITSINTNVNALIAQGQLKVLDSSMKTTMTRLSTGLRINSGADGPSDVALAAAMTAHMRGTTQAIANAEDAMSMLTFVDSSLNETIDILQRMNDLAVKASNQAILTSSDIMSINNEVQDLKDELARRATSVSFNGKILLSGGFQSGKIIQIGADNAAAYQISIVLTKVNLSGLGLNTGALGGANFLEAGSLNISTIYDGATYMQSTLGAAVQAIDVLQSAINIASTMQEAIGAQEEKLQYIINDLNSENINIAAARSRITDADMAAEISNFTRLQVLTQSATAMLAQANLQPQTVMKLLGV